MIFSLPTSLTHSPCKTFRIDTRISPEFKLDFSFSGKLMITDQVVYYHGKPVTNNLNTSIYGINEFLNHPRYNRNDFGSVFSEVFVARSSNKRRLLWHFRLASGAGVIRFKLFQARHGHSATFTFLKWSCIHYI